MISMVTPTILSAVGKEELGVFAIIFLLLLLSTVEMVEADHDIRNKFSVFKDTYNAIVIPLLFIFTLIVGTKVVMVL